jgi:hypothetical protein
LFPLSILQLLSFFSWVLERERERGRGGESTVCQQGMQKSEKKIPLEDKRPRNI